MIKMGNFEDAKEVLSNAVELPQGIDKITVQRSLATARDFIPPGGGASESVTNPSTRSTSPRPTQQPTLTEPFSMPSSSPSTTGQPQSSSAAANANEERRENAASRAPNISIPARSSSGKPRVARRPSLGPLTARISYEQVSSTIRNCILILHSPHTRLFNTMLFSLPWTR